MSMHSEQAKWRIGVLIVLVLPMLGGCTVMRLGGAGLSLGSAAVRTTGKVAGTAVKATGSVVGLGGSGGGSETDESDGEEGPP